MSRLAKLRELTWPQRRLLAGALFLLPAIAVGLRLVGLRRVQAILQRLQLPHNGGANGAYVLQAERLVAAAARHGPYKATCLPTSLTLQYLLLGRGIESDLRLGVRKGTGGLEAHAWLEHRGLPLLEACDAGERFAPFDRFPCR